MNLKLLNSLPIKKNQQLHAWSAISRGCLVIDPVMANSWIRRTGSPVWLMIFLLHVALSYLLARSQSSSFLSLVDTRLSILFSFILSSFSLVYPPSTISSVRVLHLSSSHASLTIFPAPYTLSTRRVWLYRQQNSTVAAHNNWLIFQIWLKHFLNIINSITVLTNTKSLQMCASGLANHVDSMRQWSYVIGHYLHLTQIVS